MSAESLAHKVSGLPDAPGVYLYKDAGGRIIYIGKAKSLKKRVQSYFARYLSAKTQALVRKIADIEYIRTPTEYQAQLLEAALIRKRQPQYNISLKDDKSFPMLLITRERFPRIAVCRSLDRKTDPQAGDYYGPYASAKLLRQALSAIRRIFGFRSCTTMPRDPCLYHRLGLCPAPCAGLISKERYGGIIRNIKLFLASDYEALLEKVSFDMRRAAEERRFEDAARLRDQLYSLGSIARTRVRPTQADELEDLRCLLGLARMPLRIEGFDISNISGKEATGAMVSFFKGAPDKDNYRRFRVKTVERVDDYAMLREVVRRRYRRLRDEGRSMPDLVLIDGGRQHLEAAAAELRLLGLDLAVASIAKEEENIYCKASVKPLAADRRRPAFNLIRRVRDEAHRFARAYHHLLRARKVLQG